jgi:sigma-E factor negative regulatory protein RseC
MQPNQKIEIGEVIEVLSCDKVKVKVKRHSQCIGCSQKSLCDPFGKDYMIITAKNTQGAKIGDKVEVAFGLVKRGRAIVILYVIPLILFIIGAILGNILDPLKTKIFLLLSLEFFS